MRRIFLLPLFLAGAMVFALQETSAQDDPRVQIGLRLFRTLLSADEDLEAKVAPQKGLDVVLFYRDDAGAAKTFGEALLNTGHGVQQGAIRGLPLQVHISDDPTLAEFAAHPPAGIYLVEPLSGETLAAVADWAANHHRLLFSPFEGDVERGASAGFVIEVRVQPHLNLAMLERSSVRLKDLLFKVSKLHE